jgi:hypothetical protein
MSIGRERVSGLVIVLFGAGSLLYALQYPFDTLGNPGPAVFPCMAAAVLLLLAARNLIRDYLKPSPVTGDEESGRRRESLRESFRSGGRRAKVVVMIAIFVLYILMIRWIGFFVSNFLFVIVSSRLIGARNWRGPVTLSAGVNIFCYLLFDFWLKLSFPRGMLF